MSGKALPARIAEGEAVEGLAPVFREKPHWRAARVFTNAALLRLT